jgi:putative DNA primase/helicase
MTDPISAFIDHMRDVECAPDAAVQITADDTMHYFRLDGDKPEVEKASYILRIDADGFAVGGCMNYRDGIWHKWHIKAARKTTDAERAEWKARTDAARKKQDKARADEAAAAAIKASEIWKAATPTGTNAYLARKGFTAEALGCRMSRGSVVVPMWSDGKITGLQFIDDDGGKLFLKSSAKEGAYHAIKGDGDLLVIGEGLATMGAIHATIGCSVIVAFDAGNLKPVAQVMRKKYPDKRIVIAADGDQWTIPGTKRPADWDNPPGDDPRWQEWRDAGLCVNTGADKAAQAAVAIGGALVLSPPIPATDAAKRTDWWDYWRDAGGDAVKSVFDAAIAPRDDVPAYGDDDRWEPDYGVPHHAPAFEQQGDVFSTNPILKAVRPLGRSGKTFYFFPRSCGQIMDFTGPALANMQNLVTMAPRALWETNFDMKASEKKMAAEASMLLIEACNMLGIYDPETERGVGVWMDEGRQILNAGDRLFWPGGDCLPPDFKSRNVYVMGPRIGRLTADPMGNADAAEILKICLALTWKGKLSGYMLAGWIVTAMIAGAMRWRSHIVVTGEPGAGKSWVMDYILKVIMGKIALIRSGGSTEAKIRKDIGSTARPVIMDEAESETQKDRSNMELVYGLARKSSSGADMANFNGVFPVKSSFCFAAINPRIIQGADLDRNTILHLVKNKSKSARDDFRVLEKRVAAAITPEAADRLLTRTFNNLPTILKNIETFADVLTEQEGSKRFGDQHGTLIAGAFSLTSTNEITPEAAKEWCAKHDWRWAKLDNDQSDGEKLLAFIMAARVRHDDRGMAREASVGRLIDRALNADGLDRDVAVNALGEYGMKADLDWLYVASPSKPITDMLRDTPWGGSYRRALGELDGAVSHDKMRFSAAMRLRCVAVPMVLVLGDDAPVEVELPFDMDGY